jgi:[ribosomal protein S5]-alanine N-acetyltransferase
MDLEALHTTRLALKKLTAEDLKFIFANYDMQEVIGLMGLNSEEEYLKEKQKSDIGHTSYQRSICQFLFVHRQTGKTIGRGGFHNWFLLHRRSEIGYVITDPNYREQGLMSEALKAMLDYGFTTLNLHRIEAYTATDNLASIKLLEKNQFVKEAVLRSHYLYNDTFVDSVLFSKLKHEHKF